MFQRDELGAGAAGGGKPGRGKGGNVDGSGGKVDGIGGMEIPEGNGKGSADGNGSGSGGSPGGGAGDPASTGPASTARGLAAGACGAAGAIAGCTGGAMTTGGAPVGACTARPLPAGAVVTALVVGAVLEDCASSELVCAVARAIATTTMAKPMVPTKSHTDPRRPRARGGGRASSLYRPAGVGAA